MVDLFDRLTIMVNSMILSRHEGDTPDVGANRKIPNGPLYPDIIDKIDNCTVVAWTKKCALDVQDLSLDEEDLVYWIKEAVSHGVFKGSEWCQNGQQGAWAACDAYTVKAAYWNETTGRQMSCQYYIKFCINRTGNVVMTVSFHP